MIREATLDDWPVIYDRLLSFNREFYDIPINPEKLRHWFDRHMAEGIVLVSDTGVISGLPVEDPVRDWIALVETGWYDTGRNGLRLLRRFIECGHELGVDEVRMTTLSNSPPHLETLLRRHGFVVSRERSHSLII